MSLTGSISLRFRASFRDYVLRSLASGNQPHWKQAVLSEIHPLGVFVTIAFLSWTYDEKLMWRGLLIGFGLSLVARALMPGMRSEAKTA